VLNLNFDALNSSPSQRLKPLSPIQKTSIMLYMDQIVRPISNNEIHKNGKIRLHKNWEWTSGDQSKGQSIIDEI
jgi:hypothetical protein